MKRADLIFSSVLLPFDYLAIIVAGVLAFNLRHQRIFTDLKPVTINYPFASFFNILLVAALGVLLLLAINGLYTLGRKKLATDLARIFSGVSTATLIIIVAFFFDNNLFNSRLVVLLFWFFGLVLVSFVRITFYLSRKILFHYGLGLERIVLIGHDQTSNLAWNFFSNNANGFQVGLRLNDFSSEAKLELENYLLSNQVDQIVIADSNLDQVQLESIIDFCHERNLIYKYSASFLKVDLTNFDFSTIAGCPFIEVKRTRLDGWGRIYKRFFDIICSVFGLIILVPIFLIVALVIKINSSGPVFVRLRRVGKQSRIFNLYKFRSMIDGAHGLKSQLLEFNQRPDGPLFKLDNDPRITKVGKFLRRFSLDELPQLINILKGEMSLVGPRPHEPEEVSQYQGRQKQLLAIRPGLTGLAQVSGRSDLLFAEEVKLDLYYIERWSPSLDWQIIFKTPLAVIKRRKAS